MRNLIVARLEADHNNVQKGKTPADRKPFDRVKARAAAEEACAQGTRKYVWGISFAPSTTIKRFKYFDEVDQNDACFMHSETQGTMFSTIGLDAGGHIVHYATTIFIDNERLDTWMIHCDFIEQVYPAFDSVDRRRISDQHPGLVSALKDHLTKGGKAFVCSKHHGPNVVREVNKAALAHYLLALEAPTMDVVCSLSLTHPSVHALGVFRARARMFVCDAGMTLFSPACARHVCVCGAWVTLVFV